MKRVALASMAVVALVLCGTQAQASDFSVFLHQFFGPSYHARQAHALHHAELEHRAVDRAIEHHMAHHYPMTPWQHHRLHRRLDREALYDRFEHAGAHARGYGYGFYGRSGACYQPGVSLHFGF